ncbi:MAG TPA: DUF333 domain-containing protein [Terriglobales bacterium]|jgi:uncharacterized protein|nr:DUF333 domain-containing protein [Terriglobales bacterium]
MRRLFVAFSLFLTLGLTLLTAQDQTPAEQKSEHTTPPSSSAKPHAGLANPASVNCEKKGGKLEIRKGKKGEYGVCKFPNGKECEEWALFRGKCSPDDANPKTPAPKPADQPKTQ